MAALLPVAALGATTAPAAASLSGFVGASLAGSMSMTPVVAGAAGAFTLGTLAAGTSVVSTVMSGVSSMNQAKAQQHQANLQARSEEVNGRMRAIATNTELLKTLSRNNAVAAASGLQSSGSVARANEAAQRKAAEELSVNRFNTEMQTSALKQKAEVAGSQGRNAFTGSLFDAVGTGYDAYKKIKET